MCLYLSLIINVILLFLCMAEPVQEGQEDRGSPDRGVGKLEGGGKQDTQLCGSVALNGRVPAAGMYACMYACMYVCVLYY